MGGEDTLHAIDTTPHVPTGQYIDPDTDNGSDSDKDNERVEMDIPDAQDTQGELDSAENNSKSMAQENANQENNMDSDGREGNGVTKGGTNIPQDMPSYAIDKEGRRRSVRENSRPSRYKAEFRTQKYAVQGVTNFSVQKEPK